MNKMFECQTKLSGILPEFPNRLNISIAYRVTLSLNICHNELTDISSCGKSAGETKWYNNEICKNLIRHLGVLISKVCL